MPKRRRGRTVKQNRASASAANEDEELKSAPHSFVVHKGNVGKHVQASHRNASQILNAQRQFRSRIVYSINNKGLPRWIQKRWPFLGGKKWTPMAGNSNSECVNLLLSNCKIWSWAQIKQNFISYQIAKTNFYYMRPPKASRDQKRSNILNLPPWGSTFWQFPGMKNGSLF